MKEVWKSIDWFPEMVGTYEVSNLGRLRRSLTAPHQKSTKPGRIMANKPDPDTGYLRATLSSPVKKRREQVHRLVARAFIPGFEPVRQINHKDGNKANNRIGNLEWATPRQNVLHAWKNGLCTSLKGENHGEHKLSDSEARAALYLLAHGVQGRLIAAAFNITDSAVSSLKRGKTWKHLTKQKHV